MSKAPGITGDKWRPGDRLIDERWTNTFCAQVCSLPVRLADQAEYALLSLVGLLKHSGGRMREHLRLRHFVGLRGVRKRGVEGQRVFVSGEIGGSLSLKTTPTPP